MENMKTGCMRVRFGSPEERGEIIRILEERCGFRMDVDPKQQPEICRYGSGTFGLNPELRTFGFIGAAPVPGSVRFFSAQELFRITGLDFRVIPRFPVFHIPHNGREFPEDLMESVCVPRELFMKYHEEMRDTDIVMAVPDAYRSGDMCHACSVSRLLCDVERLIGPEEIMERYGMGFCYEKAFDGTVIKHVTEALKEKTLVYYRKHHELADGICGRHPRILLFDMHSYSDRIVPEEFMRKGIPAPDVCLGTDPRFTPQELEEIVSSRFSEAGFSVGVNYPYAGCYIPNAVMSGQSGCDCVAVMLEFHKRIYCGPDGRSVPERLNLIKRIVSRVIADCIDLP